MSTLTIALLFVLISSACGAPSNPNTKHPHAPPASQDSSLDPILVRDELARWQRLRALGRPTSDVIRSTAIVVGSYVQIEAPNTVRSHSSRRLKLLVRDVLLGDDFVAGNEVEVLQSMTFPIVDLEKKQLGEEFVFFLSENYCSYKLYSEMLNPSAEDIQVIRDLAAKRMTLPEAVWVDKLLKASAVTSCPH